MSTLPTLLVVDDEVRSLETLRRILNYQIIAPTTWNFSPRDARGTRGALEQALLNAPVRAGEKDPVSVQHIVRSFDPSMVCTVH